MELQNLSDYKRKFKLIEFFAKTSFLDLSSNYFIYVILFICLIISFSLVNNTMISIDLDLLHVIQTPFMNLITINSIILSVSMMFISAITSSRERELGILEILFHGPTDTFCFVIGRFLSYLCIYGLLLFCLNIYQWFSATFLNLSFSTIEIIYSIISLFFGASFISLGLFLSQISHSSKFTVVNLLLICIILIGLPIFERSIQGAIEISNSGDLLLLRDLVHETNNLIHWVSPIFYFQNLSLSLLSIQFIDSIYSILFLIIIIFVFLFLTIRTQEFKGVLR